MQSLRCFCRLDVKAKGRLSQEGHPVTFGLPPDKGSSCLPPNAAAAEQNHDCQQAACCAAEVLINE